MKIRFIIILFFISTAQGYSQVYSEKDIKDLAQEIDLKIKGVDVNGMTARGCIAIGRTLIYQYDLPSEWDFPDNLKQEIISNFETAGLSKLYFNNNINIDFYYYLGNSLTKKISIKSHELNPYNFELSEHLDLTGHPKAKEVSMKIKTPKGWNISEGDRPNVLKKFVFEGNTFVVLIKNNLTFFSREESRKLLSKPENTDLFLLELMDMLTNSKILDTQIVTIDNYPALEFEIQGEMERSGITFNMFMKGWLILHEDKVITLQAAGHNKEEFQALRDVYSSIVNSVIFPEQYY